MIACEVIFIWVEEGSIEGYYNVDDEDHIDCSVNINQVLRVLPCMCEKGKINWCNYACCNESNGRKNIPYLLILIVWIDNHPFAPPMPVVLLATLWFLRLLRLIVIYGTVFILWLQLTQIIEIISTCETCPCLLYTSFFITGKIVWLFRLKFNCHSLSDAFSIILI